eukprot:TRINITY_DN62210_c0_g1_i1.p1 TRINITY_DN62210_c0_g1~~TRINITY_DN62210_c0_g1_i1.p1  ORF type:complete len:316 (-),score=31.13 TRINITY_DN62210_c0_g1_i1:111-1058(-)
MVIPMPVGGMMSPDIQGPPPPEFGGRFKVIKICIALLIFCAFGQLVAGALLGTFPRLVFLLVDIVVGIFLLNHDDDFKPAYSFMMETCFSACADQCRGGMSCLSNFVLINLVSFFMGMIFDAPTAILDIFVVCNGGTHGLSLGHTTHPGGSTEPGALDSIGGNISSIESHPLPVIKSQFDHLTVTASAALVIKAICMLLANLAQSVCLFQGLRIVLDVARLRGSQAPPAWSDDDQNFAAFGPGGLGLRPGQPGRWPGGLMAMGRTNGGVGNAGRADGIGASGAGGDGGNPPPQGNMSGPAQYQPFSGQGHRLGSD